jgi:hypothetical protein
MSSYKFRIGQSVMAHALGVPSGPYVVIRRLPVVGKDPQYHAKSDSGTVRAFLESQLREAKPVAANEDAAPAKPARIRGRR